MRARRAKHLTQRELADKINEPEMVIKMAEQGILLRERESLIRKIQNALNIQITKIPYDTYTKLPENEKSPVEKISETEFSESKYYEKDFNIDGEKEKRWTIWNLLGIKKRMKGEELSLSEDLKDELKEEDRKNNSEEK